MKISPTDLVGSFLKSAHERGIAALVAYGDVDETPAGMTHVLRIASNRPKAQTDGLLGKLGAVDAGVIAAIAKELHNAERGCDLCTASEALAAKSLATSRVLAQDKPWESMSEISQRRHLTHVQEIYDLLRVLSDKTVTGV